MSLLTRLVAHSMCLVIGVTAGVIPAFAQRPDQSKDNGPVRSKTVARDKNVSKSDKHCSTRPVKPHALTVKLVEDGGFAARHNVYEVNVADLSKGDEKNLTKLLKKTDLLKNKTFKSTNPHAADVIFYEITVEGKNNHSVITYDDTTLPQSYRDLVNYLHTAIKPTH